MFGFDSIVKGKMHNMSASTIPSWKISGIESRSFTTVSGWVYSMSLEKCQGFWILVPQNHPQNVRSQGIQSPQITAVDLLNQAYEDIKNFNNVKKMLSKETWDVPV